MSPPAVSENDPADSLPSLDHGPLYLGAFRFSYLQGGERRLDGCNIIIGRYEAHDIRGELLWPPLPCRRLLLSVSESESGQVAWRSQGPC